MKQKSASVLIPQGTPGQVKSHATTFKNRPILALFHQEAKPGTPATIIKATTALKDKNGSSVD